MVALNFLIHFEMQSFFKNSSHKRTKAGTTRKFLEPYSSGLQISGLLDILVPQRCIGFIILKKAWAVSCQMKRGLSPRQTYIWMSTCKNLSFLSIAFKYPVPISLSFFHLKHSTHIILIRLVPMTSLYKRQTRNSTQKYD